MGGKCHWGGEGLQGLGLRFFFRSPRSTAPLPTRVPRGGKAGPTGSLLILRRVLQAPPSQVLNWAQAWTGGGSSGFLLKIIFTPASSCGWGDGRGARVSFRNLPSEQPLPSPESTQRPCPVCCFSSGRERSEYPPPWGLWPHLHTHQEALSQSAFLSCPWLPCVFLLLTSAYLISFPQSDLQISRSPGIWASSDFTPLPTRAAL